MKFFNYLWEALNRISKNKFITILSIGILAFAGNGILTMIEGVPIPVIHDEFSYLLAADTFAHGRITNPTHPMWMHFETFHVLQQPTYMSKYPPGQGLMLALGQVVFGNPVVGVWLNTALMCMATCWMLYGWVPSRWALLGGLLIIFHPGLGIGNYLAQSYQAGTLSAVGGALVLGALRRIIRKPNIRHSLILSLGIAILANTRPGDGSLLALPVLILLFFRLFFVKTSRVIIVPMVLVLALTAGWMCYYNKCITNDPLVMPYIKYESTYNGFPLFIWEKQRSLPLLNNREMARYYSSPSMQYFQAFKKDVQGVTYNLFMPNFLFTFTFFVGLTLLFKNIWLSFAFLVLVISIVGRTLYPYLLPHYFAPVICIYFLFLVNGLRLILMAKYANKITRKLIMLFILISFFFSFGLSLRENHLWMYETLSGLRSSTENPWYKLREQIVQSCKKSNKKYLVIVRYTMDHDFDHEWVYNDADIDNAKIVWARDLGDVRNNKLMEYFKNRRICLLLVGNDHVSMKILKE